MHRPRPRDRGEALAADRLAADLTVAVTTFLDAPQRGVDLLDGVLRALLEALVELAVVRRRRHVGKVVVVAAAADLSELLLDGARVLPLQKSDSAVEPDPLGLQELLVLGRLDARHLESFARRSPPQPPLDLIIADTGQCDRLVPRRVAGDDLDVPRRAARGCPRAAARLRHSPFHPREPGHAHLPGGAVPADDPGRGSAGGNPQLQARAHRESVARTRTALSPGEIAAGGLGCRRPPVLPSRTERAAASHIAADGSSVSTGCGATSG